MKRLPRIALAILALSALTRCGDDDSSPAANGAGRDAAPSASKPRPDAGNLQPAGGGADSGTGSLHRVAGSVTASVTAVITLSGDLDRTTVSDMRGSYSLVGIPDGEYVVSPSAFGFSFVPTSRGVIVDGADVIGQDFAAIASNPDCMTGFKAGLNAAAMRGFTDIVNGDFDRDGKLDVATAGSGVALFLGDGAGELGMAMPIDAGDAPRYLATGDLDGDGRLDLVATQQTTLIALDVMLGAGDGSFAAPSESMLTKGGDGTKPALGDFDGDGDLDVAVALTGPKTVAVLLGDGDGAFGAPVEYPVGPTSRAVTSADFDGDGQLDLAVTTGNPDAVDVLFGNGDGTFGSAISYPTGRFPYAIVADDFDRDGLPDVATANNNGTDISVLINLGKGELGANTQYHADGMPFSIASGDFDGDGNVDLVTGDGGVSGVGLFHGSPDATFGPMIATRAPAIGVTVGDFNGDGKPDVAAAGGGGVLVLANCR